MNEITDRQRLMDELSLMFGPVTGSDFAPWAFGIRSDPLRQLVLQPEFAAGSSVEQVLSIVKDMGAGCWIITRSGTLAQAQGGGQ